jgi:KipI family sensor histidine kinase inhibitor
MIPAFHLVGDGALLVDWPGQAQANRLALALKADLARRPLAGQLECVPALASLLIRFDPLAIDPPALQEAVLKRLENLDASAAMRGRPVAIPVCFDADLAPDLQDIAKAKQLSPQALVEQVAAAAFTALFMGFLPGFAYLAGLPENLSLPRRASPRPHVPAGSLALADGLCAVYPLDSPGGWHLIGQTPLRLFDVQRADPFLIRAGDKITFTPISRPEFERLKVGG